MVDFIPFSPPSIDQQEIDAVVETLQSGWITTGPQVPLFESEFAAFLNAKGAVAVNSWTSGAFLVLKALGIKAGDEIITSTFTFCSTVNIIEHVGATPVLVDVEADMLNLSVEAVEKAITRNTKAIIAVHYGGHPADLRALRALAEAHHLYLIEDAAHALPAKFDDVLIGASENPVIFSFYATKNLTTAEGGMITGAGEWMERLKSLRLHGITREFSNRYTPEGSWYYEVVEPGYKCNMTDIQAAMGRVQLRRLDEFQQRRAALVARYQAAFTSVDDLKIPIQHNNVSSAWHLYPLRVIGGKYLDKRDVLLETLRTKGIGTSVHFIPIHLHPYYQQRYHYKPMDYPIAYSAFQQIFSLPLHPKLTDVHQSRIIDAVLECMDKI